MTAPEFQGKASFLIDGLDSPCETWYKVLGDLTDLSKTPLFVLHGGPVAGHEYLLGLKDLAETVIFYDQVGGNRSSHLLDKAGDESFWTGELFCNELSNLIAHLGLENRPINVLGHSWGGMFASLWASDPQGARNLQRLVIYSAPASMEALNQGFDQLRTTLPQDVQGAISRGLQTQDISSDEFKDAMSFFAQKHMSLLRPLPGEEIQSAFVNMGGSKLHKAMFGPTTFDASGYIRNWSTIPYLHRIKAPTLILRGSEEYIQDVAMQPFFDHVPKVKWITFDNATHFAHIEQRDKFFDQVRSFLATG